MSSVIDLAGWFGGVLGLIAYALVSRGRIAAHSPAFQVTNMVGAGLLAMAALRHGALSSAVMNLAWVGLGCQALVHASRRPRAACVAPALVTPEPVEPAEPHEQIAA